MTILRREIGSTSAKDGAGVECPQGARRAPPCVRPGPLGTDSDGGVGIAASALWLESLVVQNGVYMGERTERTGKRGRIRCPIASGYASSTARQQYKTTTRRPPGTRHRAAPRSFYPHHLAAISAAIVQADALALTNAAAAQNCALTLHVRNDRL